MAVAGWKQYLARLAKEEWIGDLLHVATPILGLISICAGLYLGLVEKEPTGFAAGVSFGLVGVFYHSLRGLTEFNFLTFSGKRALEDKIKETDTALDRIKELAALVAKSTVLSHAFGNRIGGMPLREKVAIEQEIDSLLTALGVDKQELESARSLNVSMVAGDIGRRVIDAINQHSAHLDEYAEIISQADGNNIRADAARALAKQLRAREHDDPSIARSGIEPAVRYFMRIEEDIAEIDFSAVSPEMHVLPTLVSDAATLVYAAAEERSFSLDQIDKIRLFTRESVDNLLKHYAR